MLIEVIDGVAHVNGVRVEAIDRDAPGEATTPPGGVR
jgi:hypothetical protein